MKAIKLAVVGSRGFDNKDYMMAIIKDWLDKGIQIEEIVSGGARGADKIAEEVARKLQIKVKVFLPDWKKNGKAAGYVRNKEIAEYSDECIVFWDGVSKGTKHIMDLFIKAGKTLWVYPTEGG